MHRASLFGLELESELPLPGLSAGDAGAPVDVSIRLGRVGVPTGRDEEMHRLGSGAAFRIIGTAAYAVRAGNEIVVEPEPGAPGRNVRLYLLGSAMGMLLHQRGLLPLHAMAVEIEGLAFAVMGRSGAGKSTLAAVMEQAGHRVVTDDVCVITVDEKGVHWVTPGQPRLRLWRTSLVALGLDPCAYPQAYSGDPSYDKFDLPLPHDDLAPMRLGGVILLEDGSVPLIEPLLGVRAMAALIENTYRGAYVQLGQGSERHWKQCMQLASAVPVLRFQRPRDLTGMARGAAQLIDYCRDIALDVGFASSPASP